MGISQWIDIQNLVTTGKQVSDRLTAAFSNIDAELTKIPTIESSVQGNTTSIATAESDISTLQDNAGTFVVLNGKTTPTVSLTTSAQAISGYSLGHAGTNMSVNATNGTFTPTVSGWYMVSFLADISFTPSNSTRSTTLSMNNGVFDIASSVIDIPRDISRNSKTLSMAMQLIGGLDYSITMSGSENIDITFNAINVSARLIA